MPIKIEVVATTAPPVSRPSLSTIRVNSSDTTNTNTNTSTNGTGTEADTTNNNGGTVIAIAPPIKLMPVVVIVPPEEAADALNQRRPSETIQRFRPSISKKQLEHEASSTISTAGPIMDRIKAGNAHARKTDIRSSLSLSSHGGSTHSTGTFSSVDEDGTPVVKVFKRASKKGRKSFSPKHTEESLRKIKKEQEEEEAAVAAAAEMEAAAADLSIS